MIRLEMTEALMTFAIVLSCTPKSQQAKDLKYKKAIAESAAAKYQLGRMHREWLYLRIIHFTWKKSWPDIDNIIKPIADALKGIVYSSDNQISKCISTRIELVKPYSLSSDNISSGLYEELITMINARRNDVLYIEVGTDSSQQAVFGPIDGEIA